MVGKQYVNNSPGIFLNIIDKCWKKKKIVVYFKKLSRFGSEKKISSFYHIINGGNTHLFYKDAVIG